MRIFAVLLTLMMLSASLVLLTSENGVNHTNTIPAAIPTVARGTGTLDWNGSFPHNMQALPLFDSLKITSSAVGDVNGDGMPDVVLASYASDNVTVHLNHNGFINTTPDLYINANDGIYNPTYVAVVDGQIAVACHDPTSTPLNNNEKILLFNISSLSTPVELEPPTIPSSATQISLVSLTVGDFNGDGLNDIAAAFSAYSPTTNSSEIGIYYAPFTNGATPDITITLGNNITYMAAGDFNHDGEEDLAVITDNGTQVAVYYQNAGNFNKNDASYLPEDSPQDIIAGDINGDGFPDLAVSNSQSGVVSVYYSTATGVSEYPSLNLSAGLGVRAIAMGDYNHDGIPDIIASRRDALVGGYDVPPYLEIFNGPFTNNQAPSRKIFAGYNVVQIRSADFNRDGADDTLICASGARGDYPSLPFVLYQRDNSLKGIADASLYAGVHPTGVALADFNGDGYTDIMASETLLNKTALFLNQGYGFSVIPDATYTVYGYPYNLAAGKLDNDALPDLVATHLLDGNVTVHLSASDTNINLTTPMTTTLDVKIGDLNNDGYNDIVVTAKNSTAAAVYIFNGGNFTDGQTPSVTIPLNATPREVCIINITGQQEPALAVALPTELDIYNQSTPGNFSLYQSIPVESGYSLSDIAVADFNGDGEQDIIGVIASDTENVSSYGVVLQSNGVFQTPQYTGVLPGRVLRVITGDFNDDGVPDFAAATNMGLTVVGYFNGTGFVKDYLATELAPRAMAAGDLSGDGKDDIVVSSTGAPIDVAPLEVGTVGVYYQKDFAPVANITAPKSIYEGHYINLSGANSTDSVSDISTLNYTWYNWTGTGWNLLGYGVNISYYAPTQGNYTFMLTVRDKEGLSNSTTATVRVLDSVPIVNFTYSNAIEGQPTEFVAHIYAYDGVYQILWDMNGDGKWDFVNKTVVNYTYPSQGNYSVNLTVIDGDGSIGYVNKTVHIQDTAPTANFTYSPTVIYEGEKVNFTDESTSYDPIVNWSWNFDTGVIEYGRNVSYAFPQQGTYYVNHTVRDSDGSVSWVVKRVLVMDTQPVVNFTYNGTYEGQPFYFYAHVKSYDSIASYYWTFGDGGTSSEEDPVHVFAQNGSYLVTLYVNDSDGSNVSYSQMVIVKDTKPSVTFTYSNAIEGQPTQFKANITSYDGIVYIHWDFGDGSTSTEENPTHIYRENGTYRVTVTVREKDGDEANCTKLVYVQDTSPIIQLKLDTLGKIVEDEKIKLNATGTHAYDGVKEYLWDFTYIEGHFIADKKTKKPFAETSYPEQGNYTIALRVVDGDGSFSTAFLTVHVINLPPTANFTFTVSNNTVYFNASGTTDTPSDLRTLNYTWHFGDGSVGYGKFATHIYAHTGTYKVTLTVRDNDGATSNITKEIKIRYVPPTPGGNPISALPWFLWLLILLTIGVAIAFIIAMKREKYTIDDVYLIDESGTLIHHATRRLKPDMDEDILSSMLVAIQEFVKDAFKGEDNVTLKSMEFGNKKIQIHKGKHLILAIISSSKIPRKVEAKASEILKEIEEKYANVIENWDGDVAAFRGVGEILKRLWD
ncbi:MAG: PKD domain-containing protein [Euryarchaeota archaeon]|nr:PKD domain-containing protein [Euryarchaeota archaeon]